MRPNIDIPWSIHGRIKEHAEHTDQTIEEAYIDTLEKGVRELPDQPDNVRLPEAGYNDFGPRFIRSQGAESQHINNSITCHPFLHFGQNAMQFRTRTEDMTLEDFTDRLARLHNVGRLDRAWFTVHQLGGALVGRGPSNLVTAIEEADDVFAEEEIPTYKNGHLLYLANLPYESEYLLIRAEMPNTTHNKRVLSRVELRFITEGIPVTGDLYRRLANALGFTELFNATELSLPQTGFKSQNDSSPNVVEKITTAEEGYDDPSVTGLIVENPLQDNQETLSYLKNQLTGPEDSLSEAERYINVLANYDELYCELTHNHGLSKDYDYKFNGLSATYIKPLFNRNSPWNISLNMEW
ncbi:hypothetical protein NDI54_14145 [Haloarcula sp. S1AR25-5A]|uniref:Uncharacterized protein n=1 Tax=Haloarcula terrestris TaxID=2950533 RepID=A0AAE4JHG0_9EURY|nr:hypothetical protein [Haloarcula terrestris]MDS0222483.1 hypothetical protein [Haloarcula terrestris]